jgi:pilus assembly protein CpaB
MGLRRLLVLVIAVTAAGGTAFFARSWIEGQRANMAAVAAPAPVEVDSYEVLVADQNLAAGSFVKPDQVRWQRWPTDDVPESYVLAGVRPQEDMIGAVVRRGIGAGEPITDGAVVKPGERGFLAAVLDPGMRAASVPITATSSNAGLIFPGDRVDLILTQTLIAREDEEVTRRVSETVLEDIRIIAMGADTRDQAEEGKTNDKAKTATFEVTPQQAETVALVTELGKLSLSLRSLASDANAEVPIAVRTESFTWDHDVSQVLQIDRRTSHLLVLRGSEIEDRKVEQGTH